jgi:hypothetical protein
LAIDVPEITEYFEVKIALTDKTVFPILLPALTNYINFIIMPFFAGEADSNMPIVR